MKRPNWCPGVLWRNEQTGRWARAPCDRVVVPGKGLCAPCEARDASERQRRKGDDRCPTCGQPQRRA